MGQDRKSTFDRMRENSVSEKQENEQAESYPAGSHARNVLFVLADGNEKFLNYGFLICADYNKSDDSIVLEFTTHTVTIKGSNLSILYRELFEHIPKIITCTDERYNDLEEDDKAVINSIEIMAK